MYNHKELAWMLSKCALATLSQGTSAVPQPSHWSPPLLPAPHTHRVHTHHTWTHRHTPRCTHTTYTLKRGVPSPTAMPPDCSMRDWQPSVDVNIHRATQKSVKKKTLKK